MAVIFKVLIEKKKEKKRDRQTDQKKKNACQPRILYLAKEFFKCKGEINSQTNN